MSADNYYYICKKDGKYYAVMGFASDDGPPRIRKRHPPFNTADAAIDSTAEEYTEYGYRMSPEVRKEMEKSR